MSAETIVKCDGCGKQLERFKEPFEISIRRSASNYVSSERTLHACDGQCFLKLANNLVPPSVQASSKGPYR
jgi:hypothetical protein